MDVLQKHPPLAMTDELRTMSITQNKPVQKDKIHAEGKSEDTIEFETDLDNKNLNVDQSDNNQPSCHLNVSDLEQYNPSGDTHKTAHGAKPHSSSRKKISKKNETTNHQTTIPDSSHNEPQMRREYTISEALKHDKQPLSLTSLAQKASFDSLSEGGASGGGSGTGNSDLSSALGHRPMSPSCIPFSSGNPSVETTEGIIHLYKHEDIDMTHSNDEPNSEMICFIGVPSKMTSHDVIQFLAPVEGWIELIKVIRDNTPNQYMLLVKFRNHRYAMDFYKNFNKKPYNSVEMDLCHLAFVERLEAVKAQDGACVPVSGKICFLTINWISSILNWSLCSCFWERFLI